MSGYVRSIHSHLYLATDAQQFKEKFEEAQKHNVELTGGSSEEKKAEEAPAAEAAEEKKEEPADEKKEETEEKKDE